jgi:superfamily II DNA or RNA helicase
LFSPSRPFTIAAYRRATPHSKTKHLTQSSCLPEREVFITFGPNYASQGDAYVRSQKVSQVRLDFKLKLLTGEVQGSQPRPYRVRLTLNSTLSKILMAGCSCPMGGICKHGAAVAFYAIKEGVLPRTETRGVASDGASGGTAGAPAPLSGASGFGVSSPGVSSPGVSSPGASSPGVSSPGAPGSGGSASGASPRPGIPPKFAQHGPTPGHFLSPNVSRWVSALSAAMTPASADATASGAGTTARKKSVEQTDFVLYILDESAGRLLLKCAHSKRLKNGAWGALQDTEIMRVAQKGAQYITDEDSDICNLFERARGDSTWTYRQQFPEIPEICAVLLDRLIATGRCYWKNLQSPITALGPPRKAQLRWEIFEDGGQILRFSAGSKDDKTVLAGGAWYVNPGQGVLGPLITSVPPEAVKCILHSPRVSAQEAVPLSEAMRKLNVDIPAPAAKFSTREEVLKPKARLSLKTITRQLSTWSDTLGDQKYTQAALTFDYGDIRFDQSDGTESRTINGDEIHVKKRDLQAEDEILVQALRYDLGERQDSSPGDTTIVFRSQDEDEANWFRFVQSGVPELTKLGIEVEIDDTFNYEIVAAEEEWEADATSGSDFWFSLDLGVKIDGRRVPLLPIIHQAIKRLRGRDPLAEFERLNIDGKFYAPLPDGRFAALPFERVKAVVYTLLEMFDRDMTLVKPQMPVNLPQMMELSRLFQGADAQGQTGSSDAATTGGGWLIGHQLADLIEKVNSFTGLRSLTPPSNFLAELRPYQLEGLSWLDFIREFGLGGILADDMGLGKTIQALAHIACEREAKRVNHPYLVVCPTSVLPNWLSEIKKFVPDFKALGLSGSERAEDFDKIEATDIVVTSYPLVSRDIDVLKEHHWQAVILDEAQYIKNPQTQMAQAVQLLRADYRLCLSGTPIENHLGELWSQFNFLMPGFLGDLTSFNRNVRNPIEKHKNIVMQHYLVAKVKPFLLRRTKELVATELPEKTVITKSVELEGAQRDLYETVRLAMYEKVQDALAVKGLAKSQIIILDAMLKLRQVCCDPRLVKLSSAAQVDNSGKLEQLLEMLEELLSEGKRILLFSQFTSMLDLIMPELEDRNIQFVQIRGDTKDRATPVQLFQSGQVPLFLLSLKAGGTGLNLTAADTVIHYDPWWNPAVENQATDRAHRIGQDKAVFVFKLIAAGTIEERMIELQDKKRAIAESIYGDEESISSKLTAEDLASLFQPLS